MQNCSNCRPLATDSSGVAALAALVLNVALLLSGVPYATAADDPSALWRIVHDQCVPHQAQFGTPLPCAAVNEPAGYGILKDRNGASQFLLIATARVSGIEDPAILAPDAPNYWLPAWDATRLVQALLGHALPRESLSLAINSAPRRSQNQFHIHVDCVSVEVRDALRAHGDEIGIDWTRFAVPLAGHAYRALRVQTLAQPGATPFQLLARLPEARTDMGPESLVVVGAVFGTGESGFYLLETRAGPGEELQDHGCAVAGPR
jgi:CDP-diacylglycerol pyrophosphatase